MKTDSDAWSSRRFALATIAGLWLLYLLLIGLRLAALDVPHQGELELRHFATALAGASLNFALYRAILLLGRRPLAPRLTISLLLAFLAGILLSAANFAIMFLYRPETLWSEAQRARSTILTISAQTLIEDFLLFAAWTTLYIAVSAAIDEQSARRHAREAQLRALNYQLNPHFLFNALNTVSALVIRQEAEAAERAIEALSDFLRVTLSLDPSGLVTLRDELRLQHDYLQIEQVRYGERLAVSVEVPPALQEAQVPPLLLQPLVENVVKHAVSRSQVPVGLRLRAAEISGRLQIVVENDGPVLDKPGEGLGLRNVRERLALLYGREARLDHGARPEGGFRAVLSLPLR